MDITHKCKYLLLFLSITVCLHGTGGERKVAFTTDFFTGYRQLAVKEDEVLLSVTIPFSRQVSYLKKCVDVDGLAD